MCKLPQTASSHQPIHPPGPLPPAMVLSKPRLAHADAQLPVGSAVVGRVPLSLEALFAPGGNAVQSRADSAKARTPLACQQVERQCLAESPLVTGSRHLICTRSAPIT
eukprot:CAMPEP_0171162812 /NCGR_PEP_ID=MMETSP0790-20130122/4791_1 /TAXON_ID=2925 /ORGANISM="Alexandrium catenella, Strain OF101" /LENGTH=107 /DNA_ID=CAMNT_0011627439 /DNA_START=9 /DNA_END=332 /DNA_ORIENTATION=+